MDKYKTVEELYKSAESYGLPEALYKAFGKSVDVRVGFTEADCNTKIDGIDFSVRASNGLKRAGLFTIGDVIDAVARDKLTQIRNLGVKTQNEIKTRLLVLGYGSSTVAEKKQILAEILDKNA